MSTEELTPDEIAILRNLQQGRPNREPQPLRPDYRSRRPSWPKTEPLDPNGLAYVLDEYDRAAGHDVARRRAKLWASTMLITPKEARAWFEAGLRPNDGQLLAELRREGVTPEMLSTRIRGETVLDRIRCRGYGVEMVVRTLRGSGLMPRSA